MFMIHMPKSFKIGDSADCRINKQPARVTYRDADTLVINDTDARRIARIIPEDELNCFICGDADGGKYRVTTIRY